MNASNIIEMTNAKRAKKVLGCNPAMFGEKDVVMKFLEESVFRFCKDL